MQDRGDKMSSEATGRTPAQDEGNRRARRMRTLKQARIVLWEWTTIDCRIRDISEDGAHLVLGGAVSLPETFRLHNVSDGTIRPVELKWQRGLDAGVAFTGAPEPLAPLKR
jgi:hypothetical protein